MLQMSFALPHLAAALVPCGLGLVQGRAAASTACADSHGGPPARCVVCHTLGGWRQAGRARGGEALPLAIPCVPPHARPRSHPTTGRVAQAPDTVMLRGKN